MNLQLFLNDKFIGEVPFDANRYDEAYLIGKKLLLQDIFADAIDKSEAEPQFFIHAESSMNRVRPTSYLNV